MNPLAICPKCLESVECQPETKTADCPECGWTFEHHVQWLESVAVEQKGSEE